MKLRRSHVSWNKACYNNGKSNGTSQGEAALALGRASFLIAEDDQFTSNIVAKSIKSFAKSISFAANGSRAQEILKQEQPDFLLLDLALPEKSGMEILRYAREQRDHRHAIFIIISGTGNKSIVKEALELGAHDFIVKPFTTAELTNRLARHLVILDIEEVRFLLEQAKKPDPVCEFLKPYNHKILATNDVFPIDYQDITWALVITKNIDLMSLKNAPDAELKNHIKIFLRAGFSWTQIWPFRTTLSEVCQSS
jgi:CheY-like chemotaxis protein